MPHETARLSEVQAILGDRGERTSTCGRSPGPDRDTPEVLADYRERLSRGWLDFFTGDDGHPVAQAALRSHFDDTEDLQDHNINMVIGNART